MADNVAITAGAGTTVAADEVVDATLGTVKAQFVKVMDGTLDSTNKLSVSAAGAAKVDGSAVTQPVSGTVTAAGQASATSSVTNVAASATNVTLKASNASRKALYITNAGTSDLFVKLGATATTTTSYTTKVPPGGYYELPDDPIYTGIVDGIWTATGGNGANVTELT